MIERSIHNFGVVDDRVDFYEFLWSDEAFGECRLDSVLQTERGPRRTELAIIPSRVWIQVSERTIRELVAGMGETERTKKAPILKIGINHMSPLIGRELTVLLWALMEVANDSNIEAILNGWRELAREERWWLYAKGAAPGQKTGAGWRLALFHALSETTNSRSAEQMTQKKKSPGSGSRPSRKTSSRKQSESRKNVNESKKLSSALLPNNNKKNRLSTNLKKSKTKHQTEKRAKKKVSTTNN